MISDELKNEVKLDYKMINLVDEIDPSSFEKLVYEIKESAGTKASIPFAALGEITQPPDLGKIAKTACINLIQRRISDIHPKKDPYEIQLHWFDPYFQFPSLYERGEVNRAISNRDFDKLDLHLSMGDLGICKYTIEKIDRLGLHDPLLVSSLLSCLEIPLIARLAAKSLLPYKEPRAIPGLVWLIKYHPGNQYLQEACDTLSAIGQPAVAPIANAYQIFHVLCEKLNMRGAAWRENYTKIQGSPLFPAVQLLTDGMMSLEEALKGIDDPLALSELISLTKEPIPRLREAAKIAIKYIEHKD